MSHPSAVHVRASFKASVLVQRRASLSSSFSHDESSWDEDFVEHVPRTAPKPPVAPAKAPKASGPKVKRSDPETLKSEKESKEKPVQRKEVPEEKKPTQRQMKQLLLAPLNKRTCSVAALDDNVDLAPSKKRQRQRAGKNIVGHLPILPADLKATLLPDESRTPALVGNSTLRTKWLQAVYTAADVPAYTVDRAKGCWRSTRDPNRKGYVHAGVKGEHAPTQLHGFSLYFWTGQRVSGNKVQVSHLCGNRNCFRPSHLVIETAQQNNARKGCLVHLNCPHCGQVAYECQHVPKCL